MKSTGIVNSVSTLRAQGHSLREISRLPDLSRNTVRRMLREPRTRSAAQTLSPAVRQRLEEVHTRAQGNAVRMARILADEYDLALACSTLKSWVRQAELPAFGPAPVRAGPADAARHFAAPADDGRQDVHGAMRGADAEHIASSKVL